MEVSFAAALWEWRGPAPFFWVTLPRDAYEQLSEEAEEASYGWGAVPVRVRIGATTWETSLIPKDGSYAVPIKHAVRRAEGIGAGDVVDLALCIAPRRGREANGSRPAR